MNVGSISFPGRGGGRLEGLVMVMIMVMVMVVGPLNVSLILFIVGP